MQHCRGATTVSLSLLLCSTHRRRRRSRCRRRRCQRAQVCARLIFAAEHAALQGGNNRLAVAAALLNASSSSSLSLPSPPMPTRASLCAFNICCKHAAQQGGSPTGRRRSLHRIAAFQFFCHCHRAHVSLLLLYRIIASAFAFPDANRLHSRRSQTVVTSQTC